MSALPLADRDGAAGRPSVSVGEASGIFVAGDWVGASGLLADTSLASAKRASEACSAHLHGLIRRAA
jgi:hypothetical protein